ncbi:hypothetical protein NDU88_007888 [Pleurodeles waltl]|uniref:Uncharacterized protein n=1 Tax=Pleurodeles waltl TaxID=8319 RepID=A0AAV7STL2_PLEWA|nr:hypothetical protein NDU88_007888 [Pleurodeles waltl]
MGSRVVSSTWYGVWERNVFLFRVITDRHSTSSGRSLSVPPDAKSFIRHTSSAPEEEGAWKCLHRVLLSFAW